MDVYFFDFGPSIVVPNDYDRARPEGESATQDTSPNGTSGASHILSEYGLRTYDRRVAQGDGNAADAQDDKDGHGLSNCCDKCLGADDVVLRPGGEGAVHAALEWGLVVPAMVPMVARGSFCNFGKKRCVRF